jgi:2,4-dienoyl-CoA reductase (NADPH2)
MMLASSRRLASKRASSSSSTSSSNPLLLLADHLQHTKRRVLSSAAATVGQQHPQQHRAEFPHLFSPLALHNGTLILPNRLLMGSMHTGLEGHSIPSVVEKYVLQHRDDSHDDLSGMAKYFQERARGGVGLMVTGGIAPNVEGWVGPFAAKLTTVREMERHKVVTDAVHSVSVGDGRGVAATPKICMQILHTGRYAYHPMAVSASRTKSPISPFTARALTRFGVERTIRDFVRCASLAQQAGYDGVEIMGSEGYLLSQFLCPRTNQRQDEYGGSLENRSRLALEIVKQTRQATGDDFIIIFRLSLLDLVEGGLRWDEVVELAQRVEAAGASIINTGIGWHEARIPTIATSVPRGAFVRPTAALKESGLIGIPLVATNRINMPQVAEDILASGASDMVSLARPLLADPEFMNKAASGRSDEINTCIACNQACLDHAFVGKTASCLVNPKACHELELVTALLPPDQRKTVGVIGAGPAGCAFAIAAAQMGHSVTLYDQAAELGGQFNMAKRVPGKEEFHETVRYFQVMMKKLNVNVKLETAVTFKDMENDTSKDKWVVATGVDPRDPKIPGMEHPKVLSYIDVLRRNAPVGKKVAVIGAGGIGFDVSEFLLHHDGHDKRAKDVDMNEWWGEWGVDPSNKDRGGLKETEFKPPLREIVLLQRKKGKVGAGLGKTTGWIHRATLVKSKAVEMVNGASYEKVDEDGNLHITTSDGKKRVLEVDNIVVCAGQVVKNELEVLAKGTAIEGRVFTIGGAFEAGELDAKRAIDMATRLAVRIHEDEVVPGHHKFTSPMGAEEKMMRLLKKYT